MELRTPRYLGMLALLGLVGCGTAADEDPLDVATAAIITTETTTTSTTTPSTTSTTTETDPCAPVGEVICETGCTLTPGYWKTHSSYGPAPYDDTWASLSSGADTIFFLSGSSYYDVLWTPPRGDSYFILAHAYIAAELNGLSGASIDPTSEEAFVAAQALFASFGPGQIPRSMRYQFIALAETLDDYNNGLLGPGHCSEGEDEEDSDPR